MTQLNGFIHSCLLISLSVGGQYEIKVRKKNNVPQLNRL